MFERMQEIIDEGIREANDKYVKEVVVKMDEMNHYNGQMKAEIDKLQKLNSELRLGARTENYESVDSVMAEKNKQLQINHEMITVLRSENGKLEKKVSTLVTQLKQKQVSESDLLQQVDSLSQKLSKTETEKPSLKSDQSEEETSAIELEKLKKRLRIEAQEVQILSDRCKTLEKDKIKLNFTITELKQVHTRRISKLKKKLSKASDRSPSPKQLDQTIQSDRELEKLKEELSDVSQRLEESEFLNNQLQQTNTSQKEEICNLSTKLSDERKISQSLEIELIESKDKISSLNLTTTNQAEELTSLRSEVKINFPSNLIFFLPNFF